MASPLRTVGWTRAAAAIAGSGLGLGAGLAIGNGQFVAVAGLLALLVVLASLSVVVGAEERRAIATLVILAFGLRVAAAALIYAVSVAIGKNGFTTGDDQGYADAAWFVAQYWHGTPVASHVPPDWGGYAFLLGTFTYIEGAVFYVLGYQVLLMNFVNAALGAGCVLLVWKFARHLFGTRSAYIAALIVALLPSLIAFSAINLKDALNTILVVAVLYSCIIFQFKPGPVALALAFIALEPIRGIRNHVYVGLSVLLPIAVGVTPSFRLGRRIAYTASAIALSAGLIVVNTAISGVPAAPRNVIQEMDLVHVAQTTGRTAFGGNEPTGAPPAVAPTSADPSAPIDDRSTISRIVTYLPTGLLYVFFAPFPWGAQRIVDLAAMPDTVVWYAILAGMLHTAWSSRRRWRLLLLPMLYIGGLLTFFAIVEGNVGTLFRHRTLVIPIAVVLASPAFETLMLVIGRRMNMSRRTATVAGRHARAESQ